MEAKELFPECADNDKKRGVVHSHQATLSNTLSIAAIIFIVASLSLFFSREYNFVAIKEKLLP